MSGERGSDPSVRIGFVGVGSIGMPVAKRFLKAGYPLCFTTTRPSAITELEHAGARCLPTPLQVAQQSDVFITALPADRDLEQVYLGPDGVLEHLHPGSMIVDISSASPMIMQRIADQARSRNVDVIDAPVSGGTWGAEQGTLTITVGASQEAYERAKPVLGVFGGEIIHVGEAGMGKVFKSVNNVLTGTTMVLIGEVLALAASVGADLDKLYKSVGSSSGNSNVWQDIVPKLVHGDRDEHVGFRLELMRKDIELATALGEDLDTPLPLTALAKQFYVGACARRLGAHHAYEIARLNAEMAGIELCTYTSEDDADVEHDEH